jgi:hypothetical protein
MSRDLDEAYAVVGEMLGYFDSYSLATWAPLAAIITHERREAIRRYKEGELDGYGRADPPKALRHEYKPDRKYPWFCADCGYPPHETLKHLPAQGTSPREGRDA